jgi:hypothetical protein
VIGRDGYNCAAAAPMPAARAQSINKDMRLIFISIQSVSSASSIQRFSAWLR